MDGFYSGRVHAPHRFPAMAMRRGMIIVVRALRVILTILYASYLTNIGLLLILLPWSDGWSRLILLMSPQVSVFLDSPVVRGVVSAFGFLHLALLVSELLVPGRSHSNQR